MQLATRRFLTCLVLPVTTMTVVPDGVAVAESVTRSASTEFTLRGFADSSMQSNLVVDPQTSGNTRNARIEPLGDQISLPAPADVLPEGATLESIDVELTVDADYGIGFGFNVFGSAPPDRLVIVGFALDATLNGLAPEATPLFTEQVELVDRFGAIEEVSGEVTSLRITLPSFGPDAFDTTDELSVEIDTARLGIRGATVDLFGEFAFILDASGTATATATYNFANAGDPDPPAVVPSPAALAGGGLLLVFFVKRRRNDGQR